MHVNDVAHVGSTLVQAARDAGHDWALWRLPEVRALPVAAKVRIRVLDLARFARAGRQAPILHVHYGLFGYYAWAARRPYVLHLHGSDVHANLVDRRTRPLVVRAVRRASAVVYSTPDLAEAVLRLRPDAQWFPAPVHEATCPVPRREPDLVVFGSRWEPVKGGAELIRTARLLRQAVPGVRLVGVAWGRDAELARDAGVALLAPMPHRQFRDLLARATVVVGQLSSGALGVTELECLAAATPLVASFEHAEQYGSTPPLWVARVAAEVAAAVVAVLAGEGRAKAELGPDWVRAHHGPQVLVRRLATLYAATSEGSVR